MLKRKKSMKFQTDLVDYKILVIGLEGSGKSSIINMIVNKEKLIDPIQTMGVETIPFEFGTVNTKTIIFYEIGGNKHNRGLIQFYYNCHGVIYVIDSSKHDQLTKEAYINSTIDSSPELSPSPQPTPCLLPQQIDIDQMENNTNIKLKKPQKLDERSSQQMPMFGRSKSAQTPSLRPITPPITPPIDTNISTRNSFVDKFKRKRNKHKPQSSIGSITLTDEQIKFLPKLSPRFSSNTLALKSGNDILQPLTMNEAKCESAQELISKLNFELKSTDIPFLIYYNKNDEKESLSTEEITKKIEYKRIIDKNREYGIFECNSSNKDEIFNGFNWLLKSMKEVTQKNKQFSKEIELLNRLNSIDLNKFGPNAKKPTCFICCNPCKNTGSYCTVCGKWYCQRDVITKMLMRKSGNSKCRECVGQKSIFGVDDRKQTK